MNTLTSILSAASSLIICGGAIWAILSERVHDGVIIKVGLILVALGFGSVALHAVQEMLGAYDLASGLLRSVLLINSGAAVSLIGFVIRKRNPDPEKRRITEWDTLDERPIEATGDVGPEQ